MTTGYAHVVHAQARRDVAEKGFIRVTAYMALEGLGYSQDAIERLETDLKTQVATPCA